MSPVPNPKSKPPIGLTQVPSCDRFDSCPHGPVLSEMRDDLHELKTAIVGTADKPGLAEKHRDLRALINAPDGRIDALEAGRERAARTRRKAMWAFLGPALGAVGTAAGGLIWAALTGRLG